MSAFWNLHGAAQFALDESMIPTRIAHPAVVYIPRKPNANGVLMYTICTKTHTGGHAVLIFMLPSLREGGAHAWKCCNCGTQADNNYAGQGQAAKASGSRDGFVLFIGIHRPQSAP